jgi:predicted GTPase
MRTLALVDGEHHPPVTRAALAAAGERGHEVVAALLLGGTEKLPAHAGALDLGVPVRTAGSDPMVALRSAIEELLPEAVGWSSRRRWP